MYGQFFWMQNLYAFKILNIQKVKNLLNVKYKTNKQTKNEQSTIVWSFVNSDRLQTVCAGHGQ